MTSKKELKKELTENGVKFMDNFNNTGIIVMVSEKVYHFNFTENYIKVYTDLAGVTISFKAVKIEIEIKINKKIESYLHCSDKEGNRIDLYV